MDWVIYGESSLFLSMARDYRRVSGYRSVLLKSAADFSIFYQLADIAAVNVVMLKI